MWSLLNESFDNGRGVKISLADNQHPVAYWEVLDRWQHDETFRSLFIQVLADCPFDAYRWETPPITSATADRSFEFVMLNSPGLATVPDAMAFFQYFHESSSAGVVVFSNLGNDAILVVPCPIGPQSAYGHLAAFVREAPESQMHELWERVGAAMQRRLGTKPVWLSTAGAGVSWLHVRLDDRPKYYGYSPYSQFG